MVMLRKLSENEADTIRDLIHAMVRPREDRGFDFQESWVKEREWCVVPVEDSGHFASEEISNVVGALTAAGKGSCFAVGAPELPAEFRVVCEIPISEAGLRAFNLEFGVLRALLTDADLSWAISCNEWFNLFGFWLKFGAG